MTAAGLVAFLRARLDEDEQVARDATATAWSKSEAPSVFVMGPDGLVAEAMAFTDARHIVRHDPARVLAEVAAKRRIMIRCEEALLAASPMLVHFARQTLVELALPYAEHPDYREEWRP